MSGSMQRGVALAATVVLLAALGWTILRPAGQYRVTAWFTQTVGLYPGSDVRVLGIAVGEITDVVPEGDRVRVQMLIDDAYDIPADADAIVLAPSLVSDRYVQFSPVYDGGATMEDGAKVPLERTATPVELDQVYGALDELSAALGPTGANKDGALSDLIATTSSPRWTTCRRSPPRWPPSTRRWASSTPTWLRWPTCWPRSGRTSPRRCPCSTRRCRTSPASSRTTPRS
jgi:ABC-type transporter Mla subunit MlaD